MFLKNLICGKKTQSNKKISLETSEDFPEILDFEVILDGLNGKNFKHKDTFLRIQFGNDKELETHYLYHTTNPAVTQQPIFMNWSLSFFKLFTKKKCYEARKLKKFGTVKIPLYSIATGPSHFNFKIQSFSESGRLLFNLKMTQILKGEVLVPELQCLLEQTLKSDFYMYNVTYLNENLQIESKMSTVFENLILPLPQIEEHQEYEKSGQKSSSLFSQSGSFFQKQKFQKDNTQLNLIFPKKCVIQKNEFSNLEVQKKFHDLKKAQQILEQRGAIDKKKLWWKNQKCSVQFEISVNQLRTANIQICIWKKNKTANKKIEKHFLIGECYNFISKIIHQANESEGELKNKIKIAKINSDLSLNGDYRGILKANIKILIPNYLEQRCAGILTEVGIRNSEPIIIKIKSQNKIQLKKLSDLLQVLSQEIVKKENSNNPNYIMHYQNIVDQVVKNINEILINHQRKLNQTITYESSSELFKAQTLFIEMASLILHSYKNFDELVGKDYLKCLKLIFEREEFFLTYIGFQDASQLNVNERKEKRINIGLKYQEILYSCLSMVLDMINQTGLQQYEKSFIEFYLAFSYFRIPEFRKNFLEKIKSINQQEDQNNNINFILLDWNSDFFDYLRDHPQFKENQTILQIALDKNWSEKFKSSSTFFYSFVLQWCNYVENTLVTKDVLWEQIEGYKQISQFFLKLIVDNSQQHTNKKFINAGLLLIKNPKNMNDIINTLMQRTNLFDQKQVINFFQILGKWFKPYLLNKNTPPPNFDFYQMVQMTLLLINTSHALGIANAINFWYEFFPIFSIKQVMNIIEVLIKFYFYELFLHWSKNVRQVFYHFLCYRIIPTYQKDFTAQDGELQKLMLLFNKRLCLIEQSGEMYAREIVSRKMEGRFGKKNKLEQIQESILKKINNLNDMDITKFEDKLQIVEQNIQLEGLKISRRYSQSLNQNDIIDFNDKKVQKYRSYNKLADFEKIRKIILKKKQLIYCRPYLKEFNALLKLARKDQEFLLQNPHLQPQLIFQEPLDEFESDFDESNW